MILQLEKPVTINTFAVDADIIAYRCSAVCEDVEPEELRKTIDGFIDGLVRDTKINSLAMFLSSPKNFRYEMAVTKKYKENREKTIRPRYWTFAKEYIVKNYGGYIFNSYEADDCIASFMTQHEGVAHAGIDKDIRQIEGWHYNFVKKHWEYTDEDMSKLKLYRQICQGDTSDNIPGLPKIGEKKAAKAIQDTYSAKEDALKLYKDIMSLKIELLNHFPGTDDEKIQAYFDEQTCLISLIDTLKIPKNICIEHYHTPIFQPQEGDFIG